MRTYIIKDKMLPDAEPQMILCQSSKDGRIYCEIKEGAEIFGPMLFRIEARQGHYTVNHEWTMRYVTDRVVPPERQNIDTILSDMGKRAYDAFEMLLWCAGKSCMDDTYIKRIREEDAPEWYHERAARRIRYAFPLTSFRLLLIFADGICGLYDLAREKGEDRHFGPFVRDTSRFQDVTLQPDGMSIRWNEYTEIMYDELYKSCEKLPISGADLLQIFTDGTVTSQQLADSTGVSRQYLQKENAKKHFALKEMDKTTLFAKHSAF